MVLKAVLFVRGWRVLLVPPHPPTFNVGDGLSYVDVAVGRPKKSKVVDETACNIECGGKGGQRGKWVCQPTWLSIELVQE